MGNLNNSKAGRTLAFMLLGLIPYMALAQVEIDQGEIIEWEFGGQEYQARIFEASTEHLRMNDPTDAESYFAWAAFEDERPTEPFSVRYYCKLHSKNDYVMRGCSTKKPRSKDRSAQSEFGDRYFKHTFDRLPKLPGLPEGEPYTTNYVTFEVAYDPATAVDVDFSTGEMVSIHDALKDAKAFAKRQGRVFARYGFEGSFEAICKVLGDATVACRVEDMLPHPRTGLIELVEENAIYAKVSETTPDGEPTIGKRFSLKMKFAFDE